ncbi:MAG: enoyl-CoA hydratase/isomerase family protein [Hyphomonadaceae bacterium]|nr:enoyl-CoA hydratase/isomerase family protein [Hyphomonadaceae bacterium]
MTDAFDHLEREAFSPLGETPLVVLDAGEDVRRYRETQAVIIGVDREGHLPALEANDFDILLTTAAKPPRPWVHAASLDAKLESFTDTVRKAPLAAGALRQVLRIGENLPLADALQVESFAYSALLGGEEFRAWRAAHAAHEVNAVGRVEYAREGDHVTLTLASPETHNAMTAAMRDALCEALAAVLDDPSAPRVTLRGAGACFSVGGELNEFGANTNLAQAHAIRTLRSVAKLVDELGARIEVVFHGACIGSGLEGPAAAARRVAVEGAFFQLPEVRMGLMPGAGGTVTVSRAIGRHRACAMMLGGARVSAATALDWGLVQQILPRP